MRDAARIGNVKKKPEVDDIEAHLAVPPGFGNSEA